MKIGPWKELQEKLPPLSRYELEELEASIGDHGVLQEILVLPDGRIIDGHHRWKLSGGEVPYRVLRVNEDVGFALGLALNIGRRQITAEQFKNIRSFIHERRDRLIETVLELRRQGKTQGEVGEILGVPQPTISRWEDTSNIHVNKTSIPDLRTTIPRKERPKIYERAEQGESQAQIAADYKIGQQRVSQIVKQERRKEERKAPELPEGKFNVILADPPWRYEDTATSGAAENHYPTMDTGDICALEVPCADDSVLFLWTTMPQIKNGLRVLESWGFRYKTGMVWVKDKIGIGNYVRLRHELVLIGTRGKIETPDYKNRPDSVIEAPRRRHSEKPDELYDIIEKMAPLKSLTFMIFFPDFWSRKD